MRAPTSAAPIKNFVDNDTDDRTLTGAQDGTYRYLAVGPQSSAGPAPFDQRA